MPISETKTLNLNQTNERIAFCVSAAGNVRLQIDTSPSAATFSAVIEQSLDGKAWSALDLPINIASSDLSGGVWVSQSISTETLGKLSVRVTTTEGVSLDAMVTLFGSTLSEVAAIGRFRPFDFELNVARGVVPSVFGVNKFALNDAVGTTMEDIWTAGGAYNWLTTAATLEVISSSANDTAAGSGTRQVTILGLDANFNQITETVATNGTSASTATTNLFRRVWRMFDSQNGTYTGSNVGVVTARVSGGGVTVGEIAAAMGQSHMSQYTIPAGHTGYLHSFSIHTDSNKVVQAIWSTRENANVIAAPMAAQRHMFHVSDVGTGVFHENNPPAKIPQMTDIWFSASNSAGAASVSITYDLTIIKE